MLIPPLRPLLVATLAALVPVAAMSAPLPVKIERFEGEVVQVNGSVHSGVLTGKSLQAGTQVQTGDDGRAQLTFSGAPTVAVGSRTDLLVHSVEGGVLRLRIASGALRIDARAGGSFPARDVRVNVGDLRLRVSGADAWTELTDRGGQVCLISGVVEAQQPSSTVRLDTPGQCLRQSGLTSQWSMVPMSVLEERVALLAVRAPLVAAAPAVPMPEPKIKALPLPVEPEPAVAVIEQPAKSEVAVVTLPTPPRAEPEPTLPPAVERVVISPSKVEDAPVPPVEKKPETPAVGVVEKPPVDVAVVEEPVAEMAAVEKPAIDKPAVVTDAAPEPKAAEPAKKTDPIQKDAPAENAVKPEKLEKSDAVAKKAEPAAVAAAAPAAEVSAAPTPHVPPVIVIEPPAKTEPVEKAPVVVAVERPKTAAGTQAPAAEAAAVAAAPVPHVPPVIVIEKAAEPTTASKSAAEASVAVAPAKEPGKPADHAKPAASAAADKSIKKDAVAAESVVAAAEKSKAGTKPVTPVPAKDEAAPAKLDAGASATGATKPADQGKPGTLAPAATPTPSTDAAKTTATAAESSEPTLPGTGAPVTPEVLHPHTPPVIVIPQPVPEPEVAMPASANTVAMRVPEPIAAPVLADPSASKGAAADTAATKPVADANAPKAAAADPKVVAPAKDANPAKDAKPAALPKPVVADAKLVKKDAVTDAKPATPTAKEDTQLAMAEPATAAASAVDDGRRWRVVLGSMPEPEKAETEAERLTARGWAVEAREYRVGDRHGYRIGFGEFAAREDAQKALDEFLAQYPEAAAWLAKY